MLDEFLLIDLERDGVDDRFPWHHFRPASTISDFEESTMKGRLDEFLLIDLERDVGPGSDHQALSQILPPLLPSRGHFLHG